MNADPGRHYKGNSMKLMTILAAVATLAPAAASVCRADFSESQENAINFGQELPPTEALARATVFLVIGSQGLGEARIGTCTGTLIERDLVLTAAHCLKSDTSRAVVVKAVTASRQVLDGSKWAAHPSFKGRVEGRLFGFFKQLVVENDIALIRLAEPADENSLTASLPAENLSERKAYKVSPVGYGKPDGTEQSQVGVLRIGSSIAKVGNSKSGSKQFLNLTEGAMTCQGDSGGPIFLSDAASPLVVGITSHGDRECLRESVATSVGFFLPWIRATALRLR
jgi:secreted trypsin-like serine protease